MRVATIALALLGALAGCLREGAVTCADGALCPTGTACARIDDPSFGTAELCIAPGSFAECDGLAVGGICTPSTGGTGTCMPAVEGVACIPTTCGDGLRDHTEACDDGNHVAGDKCSADCKSDESCGNGVVDGIAFEQCDDGNLVDHDSCDSLCRPERAGWTKLDFDRMPPRIASAMAFDLERRVAVVFGGVATSTNTFLDDTWLWNGIGWVRANPSTRPTPREGAGMVYDSHRGRIVMFGGVSPDGTLGDTWVWNGATWSRQPTSTAPPPREKFGMAYDSRRDRVVLFGGVDTDGGIAGARPTADTWEWDGATWTQVHPTASPSARQGPAMTYDAKRGKVVLFGGYEGPATGLAQSLVWEYDGVTWTSTAAPSPPSPRAETRMAWDAHSATSLLYGGSDATGPRDDLWSWNGATWTPASLAARPGLRSEHAVADDPIRGRLVVVGGNTETVVTTFEWDGAAWTTGVLPNPTNREFGAVAYDPLRGRAVLVDTQGKTWESDGRSWIATAATAPTGASATFDPQRRRVMLFGGVDGTVRDDTWLWDGASWNLAATVMRPLARTSGAMAFDISRGYAVMFGGYSGASLDDTWLWDAAGWRPASPTHVPPARDGHVVGYDPVRREIVMFGGLAGDGLTLLNDTWVWTGSDWEDRSGPPTARPQPRTGAAIAYDGARARLVMFAGGEGIEGKLQDSWEWGKDGWTPVVTDASPAPRIGHALFPSATGAGLVTIGGHGASVLAHTDDQWLLRWDGAHVDQACTSAADDQDGDGKRGCADLDCWAVCQPLCPPGVTCDAAAPNCGDGTCGAVETCRTCPGDCGACTPVCGDGVCDPGETCAGDCP